MNGANGSLLKALEVPKTCEQPSSRQNRGPALGWSLAAPGDLNADGVPTTWAAPPSKPESTVSVARFRPVQNP